MTTPTVAAQVRILQGMTVAQLQQRWFEVFGEPTRQRDREQMWKRLARKLQGDSEEAMIDQVCRRKPRAKSPLPRQRKARRPLRDRRLPPPGSAINRRYKGHEITVKVLDKGFEHQGQVYRSLSAVAREITGTNWNGYLFFGLTGGARR